MKRLNYLKWDNIDRESFLQLKSDEYKKYILVVLISISIACFLFCGWDYAIDPIGSKNAFGLRTFMLLGFVFYYIVYKITDNYKVLAGGIFASITYLALIYCVVISRLGDGASHSIEGFVVYYFCLITISYGVAFKYCVMYQVFAFVLPIFMQLITKWNIINYFQYLMTMPVILSLSIIISYTLGLRYYEKYRLEQQLKELVYVDNLTDCYNRRKFYEEIRVIMNNKDSFSVILIDIDNFKKVNDTFGHKIGDIVITKIASCIKSSIRKQDYTFRWGGEEFLVLLPNANYSQCEAVAERLVANCNIETEAGSISVSIGYGQYGKGHIDELLIEVDKALYEAKRNGKNQICSI